MIVNVPSDLEQSTQTAHDLTMAFMIMDVERQINGYIKDRTSAADFAKDRIRRLRDVREEERELRDAEVALADQKGALKARYELEVVPVLKAIARATCKEDEPIPSFEDWLRANECPF
jgi:hypothetical protein